jgi:hypothetical protein
MLGINQPYTEAASMAANELMYLTRRTCCHWQFIRSVHIASLLINLCGITTVSRSNIKLRTARQLLSITCPKTPPTSNQISTVNWHSNSKAIFRDHFPKNVLQRQAQHERISPHLCHKPRQILILHLRQHKFRA